MLSRAARRRLNEAEFSHADEPGISVALLMPDDRDLLEPLNDHTLTVAHAREIVAERRRQEEEGEVERRELLHEKHVTDCREAWEDEFGK